MSLSLFVKNLEVAVFGINILKNSSVTGIRSNRVKNQSGAKARPALNGTKLMAIKGIFEYWLKYQKFDTITRDLYLSRIGYFVGQKINELNRKNKPNSNKRTRKDDSHQEDSDAM